MDKAQLKEFAKEIMEELNLSGGKISKLIQSIAPKYNFDKQKIKVQIKRALIGQH
ncbi:MAG: hypothetical protein ACFFD2_02140 [Promethearchaeota archaeon]